MLRRLALAAAACASHALLFGARGSPAARSAHRRVSVSAARHLGTSKAPYDVSVDAGVPAAMRLREVVLRDYPVDDETLVWFFRDRQGDLQAAADKAVRYVRWRRDWGGLARDSAALKKLAKPEVDRNVGYLAETPDILGRPVVVVVGQRHDVTRRDLASSKALCVSVLDAAVAAIDASQNVEQFVVIVDLRRIGPAQVDLQFAVWLITMLRANYPKRIGQVALLEPPPLLFLPAWNFLKPHLGPHVELVRIIKNNDLAAYFPDKQAMQAALQPDQGRRR